MKSLKQNKTYEIIIRINNKKKLLKSSIMFDQYDFNEKNKNFHCDQRVEHNIKRKLMECGNIDKNRYEFDYSVKDVV